MQVLTRIGYTSNGQIMAKRGSIKIGLFRRQMPGYRWLKLELQHFCHDLI